MSPSALPAPRGPSLHALTGARFVAAMAVVIGHFGQFLSVPTPFLRQGGTAVAFFFVLSGFILTYNYAGRQPSGQRPRFGEFLRARFARVYPVHLFMLLLVTPMTLYLVTHDKALYASPVNPFRAVAGWVANVLLVQSYAVDGMTQGGWNAPAWSVSAEATFYLTFPFLLALITRLRTNRTIVLTAACVWALSVVAVVLVTWVLMHGLHRHMEAVVLVVYRAPYLRIADFTVGCLAGLWYVRRGPAAWTHRPSRELATILALTTGVSLASWSGLWTPLAQSVLFVPPFAVLIVALASGPTFLGRALAIRPVRALGEASYSLYLFHWLPLMVMWHATPNAPAAVAVLVMVGCVATSLVMFHFIENPCRRLLRGGTIPARATPVASPLPELVGVAVAV